jgi:acyl-CoA oxidase
MFAQLITQGKNYGVHAFLTKLRDPENHKPYPGITIGDCGDKLGLNGVDNGWCTFNDYRIPKDSLLDKISQVDDEGNYASMYENEGKRFAMSIASLSSGRIQLSRTC